MSADPIVYCLERLTDYLQFERLASDLMAGTDYSGIEPLGGTGDGGRDALYIHRDKGTTTIFAYSVRSDWEIKLRGDCKRIAETGHSADTVVFVSTQVINARQKDGIRAEIRERHGWSTEFCDIERIRVLLTGPLKSLVGKHPAIFVSPWFERRGGKLVTFEQRDLILIDHLPVNHAFASWLYGKLSAAGYSVWCHGLAPLAGENADASIRTLIRQRATRYLPVLSSASSSDPNLCSRIAIATDEVDRTLPCWTSDLSDQVFHAELAAIVPARFDVSWSTGLASLAQQLNSGGVAKPLEKDIGRRIALDAYRTEPLLRPKPEHVYANVFAAEVPEAILTYELDREDFEFDASIVRQWAHVQRGKFIFAFSSAPNDLSLVTEQPHRYSWRDYPVRYGVKSEDLIKMLVKRSLFVACYEAGFQWCDEHHTFYLDEEERQRHGYQHVDRVYTHVSFTGERTWSSGERAAKFRYQLGPVFRVTFDDEGLVWVTVRFYVRLTDYGGLPINKKNIPSRRKRVTKSWWNRQWLQRTVGMMQFIAGKGSDIEGRIIIGCGSQAVSIKVAPLSWECPISIDVEALDRVGNFQLELASAREINDEVDLYPEDDADG